MPDEQLEKWMALYDKAQETMAAQAAEKLAKQQADQEAAAKATQDRLQGE